MRGEREVLDRAEALVRSHDFATRSRWRIRAILDGGPQAVRALLGESMDEMTNDDLPWPNLMLSGLTRAAQKIGQIPKVRVDPPATNDNETPRKRAEKRERIVGGYDELDRLELAMPQVGRWMPGYGFAVWTVGARLSPDGIPYPKSALRDPYDCYPGEWGDSQRPSELAIARRIPPLEAKRLYPQYAAEISQFPGGHERTTSGGVLLANSGWENQRGRGLEIIEYYDETGTHILLPQLSKRVDYFPNPLSRPAFVVPKRFAFNQLIGQYDHTIGLMAAIAKINILSIIAMEDGVFTETNVIGDMDGQYRKGRFEVNHLAPGTRVEKPQSNLPYQLFEQINRIERQFRLVAGYPIQDDAQSPLSFATGAGLEELQTAVSQEVKEYQTVLRYSLQDLDTLRLEWDDQVSPTRRKPIPGRRAGVPNVEQYRPSTDIRGDYRTRRVYGLMAGWDDSAKLVGGLQLLGTKVVDRLTVQENIEGLDNLSQINERIADEDAREALMAGLVAASQNGDPKAHMALIEMLPEGELKQILRKFFTPEEPQLSAEEERFLNGPSGLEALAQGGSPPPLSTVLSRITPSGAEGGVQTVSQV